MNPSAFSSTPPSSPARRGVTRPGLPLAGVTLLLLVTLAVNGSGLSRGRCDDAPGQGQTTRESETTRQVRIVRAITAARAEQAQEHKPRRDGSLSHRASTIRLRSLAAITPCTNLFAKSQAITPRQRATQGLIGLAPPMVG